jgi:hypothetical protein
LFRLGFIERIGNESSGYSYRRKKGYESVKQERITVAAREGLPGEREIRFTNGSSFKIGSTDCEKQARGCEHNLCVIDDDPHGVGLCSTERTIAESSKSAFDYQFYPEKYLPTPEEYEQGRSLRASEQRFRACQFKTVGAFNRDVVARIQGKSASEESRGGLSKTFQDPSREGEIIYLARLNAGHGGYSRIGWYFSRRNIRRFINKLRNWRIRP